jgi:hypothetical protein
MGEENPSRMEARKMTIELVGSVAAVVAILVSIILAVYNLYFVHHEASKAIEATVISRSQLLNPEVHKKPSDLHLVYKNHEIFDLGILQIRIRNSGAQPIAKADIEEPLIISVEGATEIISAPIVHTQPANLPIATTISGTKVELNKSLLNPDDAFTVEIDALTADGGKLDISGVSERIAGVQNVVFQKSLPEKIHTATEFPIFAAVLGAFVALLAAIIYRIIYRLWGGNIFSQDEPNKK